jgi:hypothetical protein
MFWDFFALICILYFQITMGELLWVNTYLVSYYEKPLIVYVNVVNGYNIAHFIF